jgi:CheY-like chemotaxis protein/anti-sigma regulatory factor (Ser/Thr protein kinase)
MEYAENGSEALARMKDAVPDLIITDMQMPDMDGLELVAAARDHYPHVPVILMTAYGNETLAVEALERGAASYVPKALLAQKLVKTVEEVLALARADRSYEQLIDCLARTEFVFLLDNNPALVDALVDLVQQMIVGVEFCDFAGRLQIGVALKEALTNAMYHGNLEVGAAQTEKAPGEPAPEPSLSFVRQRQSEPPYRDRKVFVDVKLTREEVRFVVRDEGGGFDVAAVPDVGDPNALEPERGRGLSLMRTFMDHVTYNEAGNEVTMVKRREDEEGDADGARA